MEKASPSLPAAPPADTFRGIESSKVDPSGPRDTDTLDADRSKGADRSEGNSNRRAAADSFQDAGLLCSSDCGCGDYGRDVQMRSLAIVMCQQLMGGPFGDIKVGSSANRLQ